MIPAALRHRLSRLSLQIRKRGAGLSVGERRSTRRGQSQEFADHRPYVQGDDLRHLDWHLAGRLDALWVKLFEEESDRVVQLLVDASASMEGPKLDHARQIAAALAWVALGGTDRVLVAGLSDRLAPFAPPRRGRRSAPQLFSTLEQVHPGGRSEPDVALAALPRQRGSGLAVLISDLFYPDGPKRALQSLIARHNEVLVIHVLAPEDLRPDLGGDCVLVDAETGEELPLSVDEEMLDVYAATVQAWSEEMARACRAVGASYVRSLTHEPVDDFVLRTLRREGWVS